MSMTDPGGPSEATLQNDPWLGANPLDPAFHADPYPALKRLREIDPVNETPFGFWRLTRYDDVVRLLREVPTGVRSGDGSLPQNTEGDDDAGAGAFMLQQDPPNHTRLRRLVSKAFTPRAIEGWRDRVEAITNDRIDRVESKGEMDVVADLALPVPSTLICEMLGVPLGDRETFTTWTAEATHGLMGDLAPPDVAKRADAAGEALGAYFQRLIADHRKNLTDDLLSTLIRAEEEGDRLSESELLSQSIGLLIAGFETTIGLIGNGTVALLRNPDQLAKLRANPNLIESAVEECLRYDGPIALTGRVLREDTTFGDKVIPKDTSVWAYLAGANRDPARFPDPDRFDIERQDNAHVAFGGGAHLCLGIHLARMEAQIAIGTMVQRLSGLELLEDRIVMGPSLFRVPGRVRVRFDRGGNA